jgi:hypothetical protein
MQLLGGAMTAREFSEVVVPRLASKELGQFRAFNLAEKREQDDKCPGGPVTLYFKSLLYFVARSLEQLPSPNVRQTPMVGLETSLSEPMSARDKRPLGDIIDKDHRVISPTPTGGAQPEPPGDARSHAQGHGDLDNDPDTLTSVLLRILGSKTIDARRQYAANAPTPSGAGPGGTGTAATLSELGDLQVLAAAATPADVARSGPMAAAPPSSAKARPKARASAKSTPESATPEPTTVDYSDMLTEDGWVRTAPPTTRRTRAAGATRATAAAKPAGATRPAGAARPKPRGRPKAGSKG